MTLEILCKGHIAEICGWCSGCKKDDYNRECPHYFPTLLQIFDVEDKQIYSAEKDADYLLNTKMQEVSA